MSRNILAYILGAFIVFIVVPGIMVYLASLWYYPFMPENKIPIVFGAFSSAVGLVFVIWANYDIEEQTDVRTSVNYLKTMMLLSGGMKLSGYDKFLAEQMQQIPVFTNIGYWGEDGAFYTASDKESPYYEQVNRYHMFCYNHLFDTKNRWSGFALEAQ